MYIFDTVLRMILDLFLIYLNQILDNRKGVSKTGQQFSE